MYFHRLGPFTMASTRRLPELPVLIAAPARADWTYRVRRTRTDGTTGQRLQQTTLPDGRPWLSIARTGQHYRLRFHRFATFDLDPIHGVIDAYPTRIATPATVRHLLLDQVLPLASGAPGRLALHASAVYGRLGVVGFLGPAGAGKSTLAVSLARAGWGFVADDWLLVERTHAGPVGVPVYPGPRLRADSAHAVYGSRPPLAHPVAQYTRKARLSIARAGFRVARRRAPIAALYLLHPERAIRRGRVRIASLSARDAMMALLRYTFHLDITDGRALASSFAVAGAIAATVPVRRLSFPHDLDHLEDLRGAIEVDVSR
jgi:hypothetical protein